MLKTDFAMVDDALERVDALLDSDLLTEIERDEMEECHTLVLKHRADDIPLPIKIYKRIVELNAEIMDRTPAT